MKQRAHGNKHVYKQCMTRCERVGAVWSFSRDVRAGGRAGGQAGREPNHRQTNKTKRNQIKPYQNRTEHMFV